MLRFDPDKIEESGGLVAIASIGQEAVIAMGANSGRENIFFLQALTLELAAVGGNEIQKIFSPDLGMRPEYIEGKSRGFKFLPDILPHFVAFRTDAGAKRGQERRGPTTIMGLQFSDGAFGDPLLSAPPARVNGGDDGLGLIDKKKWKAVRRFNDQKNPGQPRGQGVPCQPPVRQSIDKMDLMRMDLIQPKHLEISPLWTALKIPKPPGPRSEAVDEPGDPGEPRDRQVFLRIHLFK